MKVTSLIIASLVLMQPAAFVQTPRLGQTRFGSRGALAGGQEISVNVDGVSRQALVFGPKSVENNPPVVFCFHGHGGNMRNAARSYDLQALWPEAVIVYAQGLPASGALYDPQGTKNGWIVKSDNSNRDLKFVDALYKQVQSQYHFSSSHAFAMGHSNGAFFAYCLWATRPDLFAGFGAYEGAMGNLKPTHPKPIFITIGRNDKIVPQPLQRNSFNRALAVNGSSSTPQPYGPGGQLFTGKAPTVLWQYEGGHAPDQPSFEYLVEFFKAIANPPTGSR